MLDLARTEVTDAGIKELKELKGLQTLYLGGAKITYRGVQELKTARPNLQIAD